MSLLPQLQSMFTKYDIRPVKFRGQNFLVDEEVLDEIISAADIKSSDTVLEIGPGLGFLTEKLIARAGRIIAVELDAQLFKILKEKFFARLAHAPAKRAAKNLELVNQDILEFDTSSIFSPSARSQFELAQDARASLRLWGSGSKRGGGSESSQKFTPPRLPLERGGTVVPLLVKEGRGEVNKKMDYKLVANIPYEITSPILQKFLTCVYPPREMVIMVQKEVAERICATSKLSLLSVSVGLYGTPEIVATVPRGAFYPVPGVESAILRVAVKKSGKIDKKLNEKALKIAKIGFSHPRKKLLGNLAGGLGYSKEKLGEIFASLGLGENIRAEELRIEDWLRLTAAVMS